MPTPSIYVRGVHDEMYVRMELLARKEGDEVELENKGKSLRAIYSLSERAHVAFGYLSRKGVNTRQLPG
jgi:hypothetical protein